MRKYVPLLPLTVIALVIAAQAVRGYWGNDGLFHGRIRLALAGFTLLSVAWMWISFARGQKPPRAAVGS